MTVSCASNLHTVVYALLTLLYNICCEEKLAITIKIDYDYD